MRILGIDPGTARIGWGVIDKKSNTIVPISYGLITTEKTLEKPRRLMILFTSLLTVFEKYKPDVLSIEDLFFTKNAKTAISVGEARGVILLASAKCKVPVVSYTPLAVKRTITGNGRADKKQVGKMIVQLFHLKEIPKPDDTVDALAIAATHAYTHQLR